MKNLLISCSIKNILKKCPIQRVQFYNEEPTFVVKSKNLTNILLFFKNHVQCQFKILTCISGVDYLNNKLRFMVVYELLSLRYNSRIRVKLFTDELLSVDSVYGIYSASNWYECEIWDMFGIFFKDHPNLKRILTDYGFEGHPLRKDFPLSGFLEVRYNELKKRVLNEPLELSQEYRTFNFTSPWLDKIG